MKYFCCIWWHTWNILQWTGGRHNLLSTRRGTFYLAATPLKSIPMSRHMPEMPAECQTFQIWLPITVLTLRWYCADVNCLFSWPWWRHRERSDPRDTNSKSKIPSTLLTPLLRCALLRRLSTQSFWSTMKILLGHVHRAMPRSVNPCIS